MVDRLSLEMSGNKNLTKKQHNKKVAHATRKRAIKKLEGAIRAATPKRSVPRAKTPISGRGGYWSELAGDIWGGVKKVASFVPEAIGVYKGLAPLLSGFGAYKVRKNSLMHSNMSMSSGVPTNPAPVFSGKQGSDIVLSHREFVLDVASSVNFTTSVFALNPGNPVLFPWLSRIACLYEEYEFLGMVMEYRSLSSTAVGTTTSGMGAVITATDYDVLDRNFDSKRQMEAAEFSVSGVPYSTFVHPIECDPQRNVVSKGYVVPGIIDAIDAPGDPRLSVLGNFNLATVGQQTTGDIIGELWVTYHVRLSRPMLETLTASNAYSERISGSTSTTGTISGVTQRKGSAYSHWSSTDLSGGVSPYLTLSFNDTAANSMIGRSFLLTFHTTVPSTAPWTAPIAPGGHAWAGGFGSVVGNSLSFPVVSSTASVFHDGADTTTSDGWSASGNVVTSCVFTVTDNNTELEVAIPYTSVAALSWDIYISEYNVSISLSPSQRTKCSSEMKKMIEMQEQLDTLYGKLRTLEEATTTQWDDMGSAAAAASPVYCASGAAGARVPTSSYKK